MVLGLFAAAAVVQDFSYDPSRAVRAANAAMGGYSKYAADAVGDGAAFDPSTMAASDEKWILLLVIGYAIWFLWNREVDEDDSATAMRANMTRAVSNAGLKGVHAQRMLEQSEFREVKRKRARQLARQGYRADIATAQYAQQLNSQKAEKDYSARYGEEESPSPKGKGKKNKKKY